jgi:predicted enzyme related to lactoylglutathione lyase
MGNRWRGVVVVATDPARLSRWWAEVLGYRILAERRDEVDVGPGEGLPQLSFSRATVALPGPSRIHLDISVDDRDAELERLVNMGARPVEGGAGGRLVLVDPEGNEFSLLRTEASVPDPVIAPAT